MKSSLSSRSLVFRFLPTEVEEMELIAQVLNGAIPDHFICESIAQKFSISRDSASKVIPDQVKLWFRNRGSYDRPPQIIMGVQATQNIVPLLEDQQHTEGSIITDPHHVATHGGQSSGMNLVGDWQINFEAKSFKNGAWYNVDQFLCHRYLESGDPEVKVRFSGLGTEQDEWLNVRRSVRQRSVPCLGAECVAVLCGDLVLCFKEDQEQALYFDARVLDVQRRMHDIRGCRCRFHVRYEHDRSEEIVSLRKVFRRPETNYRLPTSQAAMEIKSA